MTIVPVGFCRVSLRFGGAGLPQGAQVIFGLSNAGAATPATVGARVVTAWTARLRAQTMTAHTLVDVLVKNGPDATGPSATVGVGLAGSQAGACLPPLCCFLVRKNTALGGRHGRGYMFYPALGETFVDDAGALGAGVAAASDTRFNAFRTDLTAVGHDLVLLHAGATSPTTITTLATQPLVATQRDRLRR